MRRIDQVLGGEGFFVDSMVCASAAENIKLYHADIEKAPWANLPLSTQLTFKLAFVSICHEFNWDFMQNTLAKHLLEKESGRLIDQLIKIDAKVLGKWLEEYPKPERIRGSERAALLRDFARKLSEHYGGDAGQIIELSGSCIAGENGFLARLDIFEAYGADPLRKKSNVLLHDLVRENIVRFHDEENIAPAVDYHIMRLYLRTGRVIPSSIEIANELKGKPRPRPRLVKLLRECVSEALKQTAFYAGLTVADVNYIEWQLGRAICLKDCPACQNQCFPGEVSEDVARLYQSSCPYIEFCEAYKDEGFRALREPNFKTSFY